MGSGLPTKLLLSKDPPLVLFCSSSNHSGIRVWNVLLGVNRQKVRGYSEMKAILLRAIEAHASGRIPYHSLAIASLEAELRLLEQF